MAAQSYTDSYGCGVYVLCLGFPFSVIWEPRQRQGLVSMCGATAHGSASTCSFFP